MIRKFISYLRAKSGSVSTEAAFVIPVIVILTGCAIEFCYVTYQWNGAIQSARHGARVAATSNPVATQLRDMTGLGQGVEAGDPMPDYSYDCSGSAQSCNQGSFDQAAMNAIVYGPDQDLTCASTARARRGMCDVFDIVSEDNVDINYSHSGFGRAGFPPDPAPLITVTIRDLKFDFVFLDAIAPAGLKTIPPVTASIMGGDLRNG